MGDIHTHNQHAHTLSLLCMITCSFREGESEFIHTKSSTHMRDPFISYKLPNECISCSFLSVAKQGKLKELTLYVTKSVVNN